MKKKISVILVALFVLLLTVLCAFSAGAYEPDGTSSEEYEYPAADCNRTVYVNCVDKDTGETVKSVTYHTKRDVDDLISLSLYGYDITDFTSNAGLFQSCKLTWASGTGLAKYAYIQISYKFTGMVSGKSITATVTVRKSEQITLVVRHRTVDEKGNDRVYDSYEQKIDYYEWVDLRTIDIPGYRLKDEYSPALTGNFSYSWLGASENIGKNAFGYRYVATSTNDSMKDWSTFHEDKQGKLDYCVDRAVVVNFYYTLQVEYDLGVTSITVAPMAVYQYDTVTVRIRLDNWDHYYAYADIPVNVYLDGVLIDSRKVDFDAYGITYVTFSLEVGSRIGERTLLVCVNQRDRMKEVDSMNNERTVTFSVRKMIRATVTQIAPNAPYTEGNEVITSFYVTNYSTDDLIPAAGVSFRFTVIDAEGNTVTDQEKTGVVIPARSSNLIWFRWTVPPETSETELTITGTLSGNFPGSTAQDLCDLFAVIPVAKAVSHTPETSYEPTAPAGYSPAASVPTETPGRATWAEWVYDEESGSLILMEYGVTVSADNPVAEPDDSCPSAVSDHGVWVMKSGYGINLAWRFSLAPAEGYRLPDANACTAVQTVYATLPEYGYSLRTGQYETLTDRSGEWEFADGIHDLPLWIGDGNYTVVVTATELWTPAGMVTARRRANPIRIEGSVYDDWTGS